MSGYLVFSKVKFAKLLFVMKFYFYFDQSRLRHSFFLGALIWLCLCLNFTRLLIFNCFDQNSPSFYRSFLLYLPILHHLLRCLCYDAVLWSVLYLTQSSIKFEYRSVVRMCF